MGAHAVGAVASGGRRGLAVAALASNVAEEADEVARAGVVVRALDAAVFTRPLPLELEERAVLTGDARLRAAGLVSSAGAAVPVLGVLGREAQKLIHAHPAEDRWAWRRGGLCGRWGAGPRGVEVTGIAPPRMRGPLRHLGVARSEGGWVARALSSALSCARVSAKVRGAPLGARRAGRRLGMCRGGRPAGRCAPRRGGGVGRAPGVTGAGRGHARWWWVARWGRRGQRHRRGRGIPPACVSQPR
mmetsp:Transcript_20162/g.68384  ORF Transcript_20162/g.68384 Transcript_20162/m.68384 type:complete len:245 (+) Transcript_20162:95-829(+)